MSLTQREIKNIIKEFGESLNIKNFNDNAEYFENKSKFLNGLEQMLKLFLEKTMKILKQVFIIT